MRKLQFILLVFAALMAFAPVRGSNLPPPPSIQRERLLMDFGWKFHLGNEWGSGQYLGKAGSAFGAASANYSDAGWRTVDLPHDWAIELPFDQKGDISHGFKALGRGFAENSVGWYRRSFTLTKAESNRRVWLEFDGVSRDCTVFVNGWCMAHQPSGYSSFRCDITDVVNWGGHNVVAVRVDATEPEGWFYEGAGIYRHVWLVKTAPVAVAPDGIFVQTSFRNNTPGGAALVQVQTEILNTQPIPADVAMMWELYAPDGQLLARGREPVRIEESSTFTLHYDVRVDAPVLWSPENPKLYKLTSTLVQGQQTLDRSDTFFGARTIAFDAQRGFLLNGQPYVIKGTCNHQDHAGVGAALPDRLQYFRIAKLKEMGSNAYRTSHNPPTAELLEACDRLGMLVMDENRLLGSDPDNMDRLARLVRRDRNHPSVFMWSIANEEFSVQASPAGKRVASTMQAAIRRLDTTRPITYAAPMGNEFPGINEIIEVRGWNYHLGPDVDAYHQAHPKQPHIGTEQASTLCTRGIYANDTARGYVCAYDVNYPPWGNNAEDWWTFYQARPWLSGGFVWTGFDYRGEPTPYAWPCISSHFGIFDTCGFPKDNFWYYRSWWQDEPVLHILPHWNWFGHDGQEIEVRALSNCDEVELFLNGVSLGKQTMPRNSQLSWKVKYAPGTLSAKGYKGGRVVAEDKVESTGAAAAVQLLPDRPVIDANGEDLSIVTVAVTDEQGRTVPTAGDLVSFEVEGPGRILGVGNGDPSCHEPDKYFAEPAFRSVAVSGWRTKAASGTVAAIPVEATEGEIDAAWTVAGNGAGKPQVEAQQRVFFRTHLTLTAEETAAPVIELLVGKLDGESTLFVNGQKVGLSPDGRAPAVYDVKKFLKTGDNIVTVLFNNYNMFTTGWVDEVALRLQQPPLELKWSRSVFNGLAQVIVQATKEPGEIRLNARAGALKGAAVTIQSKATAARPCVP